MSGVLGVIATKISDFVTYIILREDHNANKIGIIILGRYYTNTKFKTTKSQKKMNQMLVLPNVKLIWERLNRNCDTQYP